MQSMYDPELVKPMWQELVYVGFTPLTTEGEVEQAFADDKGTALLMINSVCGCAAGTARPGVMKALQHTTIPDALYTVFAGVDIDATNKARSYIQSIPPSSPFIALFKDGKIVYVLERRQIEMMDDESISEHLRQAFDSHCSKEGPSIPKDKFDNIQIIKQCGSSIPTINM
jgi:putative YphP/YqiW family bacilliredoxin